MSMHVALFASSLPLSYNPLRSQLLGSQELPCLGEVVSRLRQVSVSNIGSVAQLPPVRSALATTVLVVLSLVASAEFWLWLLWFMRRVEAVEVVFLAIAMATII